MLELTTNNARAIRLKCRYPADAPSRHRAKRRPTSRRPAVANCHPPTVGLVRPSANVPTRLKRHTKNTDYGFNHSTAASARGRPLEVLPLSEITVSESKSRSHVTNSKTFSAPKISTKSSPVHAVSRHIAPLRDRRSPVAATAPRKIKFHN